MELIPANSQPKQPLLLIDGSSIGYRAYHALPPDIQNRDGFPTGALLGFSNILMRLLDQYHPHSFVVAWDVRGRNKRLQLFEGYKAGRSSMPDALQIQWPMLRDLVDGFGGCNVHYEGYEADDVLGTLCATLKNEHDIVLVSSDRDLLQLVDDRVCVVTPRTMQDMTEYSAGDVYDKFGVVPEQIPDLIAIRGDKSDNIPGVMGIGAKGAAKLLQEWGSIDNIYKHLDEINPPGVQKKLRECEDEARMSLELATLHCDLDLDYELCDREIQPTLVPLLKSLEFRQILDRLPQMLGEFG